MPDYVKILLRRYVGSEEFGAMMSARDTRMHLDQLIWLQGAADPGVGKIVSFLLFDCMLDSRVSANHRPLDGGIAPVSWTGWNLFAPPLGSGCRCTLVAITRARAMSLLAKGSPYFDLTQAQPGDARPDAGWERRDGWWEEFLEFARSSK